LLLLVLAFLWRRRAEPERGLLWLGAGFFVLAAGRYLPLFYLGYFLVPGWRLFRSPARYAWFFVLLAATTVGLTVSRIAAGERPPDPERVRRLLRRVWITLAALCVLTSIAVGPLSDRFTTLHAATMRWALAKAVALLVLAGLLIDAWLRGASSPHRTSLALIALTVTDLGLQWLPYRQTVPQSEAFPPAEITRALAAAAPGRVLVHVYRGDGLPEIVPLLNWGEAAGYDDLRGYNQLVPSDLLQLFARADVGGLAQAKHYALAPVDPADWLLDLAAVRRIVARPNDWPARWRALPLVASAGDYEVRERAGELPRAWLVGAVEQLGAAAALARLPSLDLHRVAVVDADLALPRSPSAPPGDDPPHRFPVARRAHSPRSAYGPHAVPSRRQARGSTHHAGQLCDCRGAAARARPQTPRTTERIVHEPIPTAGRQRYDPVAESNTQRGDASTAVFPPSKRKDLRRFIEDVSVSNKDDDRSGGPVLVCRFSQSRHFPGRRIRALRRYVQLLSRHQILQRDRLFRSVQCRDRC
jgi:hypothetical protein